MPDPFTRLFLDHPREVGESWGVHFLHASAYGLRVLKVAGICFAHALVPGLYRTRASDEIKGMAVELAGRAGVAREERMRRVGAYDPGL